MRSLWKGIYVYPGLAASHLVDGKRIWKKSSTVLSSAVNKLFEVHFGNGFRRVRVTIGMVGHKWGEFVVTKAMGKRIHKGRELRSVGWRRGVNKTGGRKAK